MSRRLKIVKWIATLLTLVLFVFHIHFDETPGRLQINWSAILFPVHVGIAITAITLLALDTSHQRRKKLRRIAVITALISLPLYILSASGFVAHRGARTFFYSGRTSIEIYCGVGSAADAKVYLKQFERFPLGTCASFSPTWRTVKRSISSGIQTPGGWECDLVRRPRRVGVWLSLWLPLVLTGIPALFLFKYDYRQLPGHCDTCRYDLTGNTSGICPECGNTASADKISLRPADSTD